MCPWAAARPRAVRAASFARRVVSKPGQAPPPPTGTVAGPSGALHASGAVSLACGLVRVVTNVVNRMAFSLKMLVFGLRLTTFVTGVLARRFELRWFDDVCNVGRPLVARPGPDAAHGRCGQALPTRRPGCLKPLSPLRACACVGLKPSSPLRVLVEPRLKPSSPLWVLVESRLKPSSPLRVPAEPQLKPPSVKSCGVV